MRSTSDGRRGVLLQRALVMLGVGLLGVALGVVGNNLYVSSRAKEAAQSTFDRVKSQMGDASTVGSSASAQVASVVVDGRTYVGTIEVPSLGLSYPVSTEWRDEDGWSRLGACRLSGSVADGDLVVAVYDSSVSSGLTEAADGDSVVFTDVNGTEHSYTVASVETVDADDLGSTDGSTKAWSLTLLGPTFSERDRVALRCVSS